MKPLTVESKLAILALARESGNVAFACFSARISRSLFYKIKKAYDLRGIAGLEPTPRRKPRMPNAFSEQTIARILEETRKFPTYSYDRIAGRLRSSGFSVSGSGVRKVWVRRALVKKGDRLRWSRQNS